MSGDEPDHGAYVRRVRADTQRYASELLLENERLRLSLVAAEQECRRLAQEARSARLEADLLREREDGLRAALERVEQESRGFGARFLRSSRRTPTWPTCTWPATACTAPSSAEVLEVIQEILVNLVGCEELAVYELPQGAAALELLASNGIDAQKHARVSLGDGAVEARGRQRRDLRGRGRLRRRRPAHGLHPAQAGRARDRAIVLFRLLPQKPSLAPVDRELFDLLATHAATALYCSGLARLGQEAA